MFSWGFSLLCLFLILKCHCVLFFQLENGNVISLMQCKHSEHLLSGHGCGTSWRVTVISVAAAADRCCAIPTVTRLGEGSAPEPAQCEAVQLPTVAGGSEGCGGVRCGQKSLKMSCPDSSCLLQCNCSVSQLPPSGPTAVSTSGNSVRMTQGLETMRSGGWSNSFPGSREPARCQASRPVPSLGLRGSGELFQTLLLTVAGHGIMAMMERNILLRMKKVSAASGLITDVGGPWEPTPRVWPGGRTHSPPSLPLEGRLLRGCSSLLTLLGPS